MTRRRVNKRLISRAPKKRYYRNNRGEPTRLKKMPEVRESASFFSNRVRQSVSPFDIRALLLGIYLLAGLILNMYFLGICVLSEPPSTTTGNLRIACCGENGENCPELSISNSELLSAQSVLQSSSYMCVKYFNRLTVDGFLFIIVIFAGMLGANVRGLISLAWRLGVGNFSFSWGWHYVLQPIVGGCTSLLVYFVFRAAFYNVYTEKNLIPSIAIFISTCFLTGLFSDSILLKLREVSEVFLSKSLRSW